jgi:hypothetical protein
MSLRLDPRHLATLRNLAAEAGVRPGELVTIWVTERLDAERRGAPSASDVGPVLESLNERIESLSRRIGALEGGTASSTSSEAATKDAAPDAEPAPAHRRGRPPKKAAAAAADGGSSNGVPTDAAATDGAPAKKGKRKKAGAAKSKRARGKGKNPAVPLHDEIAAVLAERGPLSAADLATAVSDRGNYAPPRSAKPLDATAVSVRVSNPRYRSRFTRADGKIGLA